jgi:hypothetical protein
MTRIRARNTDARPTNLAFGAPTGRNMRAQVNALGLSGKSLGSRERAKYSPIDEYIALSGLARPTDRDPGQRPGIDREILGKPRKGEILTLDEVFRPFRACSPDGPRPRALPWASIFRPFGAEDHDDGFEIGFCPTSRQNVKKQTILSEERMVCFVLWPALVDLTLFDPPYAASKASIPS